MFLFRALALGLLIAISIPIAVSNIIILDKLDIELSCWNYFLLGLFGFLLGSWSSWFSDNKGPIDNWETWASVANNKSVGLIVLIFTFSPTIVKTSKQLNENIELGLIFYSYWLCGLSLFFFILIFKLTSPKVFRYFNYEDFVKNSNSFIHLRDDAKNLRINLEKRKNLNKLKKFENSNIDGDINILKKIETNEIQSSSDAFKVLRTRSSHTAPIKRFFVALFVLVPAYLLPIVFVVNTLLVASELSKSIEGENSKLRALLEISTQSKSQSSPDSD